MNTPLEIVEERNGTFKDALGRPMVIVFDAKEKVYESEFNSDGTRRLINDKKGLRYWTSRCIRNRNQRQKTISVCRCVYFS